MSSFGDELRRLADEGPSDEGLLAAVHVASARAAVRRKVLLSSTAAVAVLLGGIGVVSANGSDRPTTRDLVLGASETPTPEPTLSPTPTKAPPASPGPTRTQEAEVYRGRAVSQQAEPIAELYVYVMPPGGGWADAELAGRTALDGSFTAPCGKVVALNAFRVGVGQDGFTPNWRTTFVDGGSLPSDVFPPTCGGDRQDTTVPRGLALQGTVSAPEGCDLGRWRFAVFGAISGDGDPENDPNGDFAVGQTWLTAPVTDQGSFQLAGLNPRFRYQVRLVRDDGFVWTVEDDPRDRPDQPHIREDEARELFITWVLTADACPDSTTTEPTASATPEPTGTPTPEPSPSPSG